jgi:hypothetical protein
MEDRSLTAKVLEAEEPEVKQGGEETLPTSETQRGMGSPKKIRTRNEELTRMHHSASEVVKRIKTRINGSSNQG